MWNLWETLSLGLFAGECAVLKQSCAQAADASVQGGPVRIRSPPQVAIGWEGAGSV